MLSEKNIQEIKKQLIEHINATFPEDKKAFAVSQIQGMSSEELLEFLRKNKIIPEEAYKKIKSSKPIQPSPVQQPLPQQPQQVSQPECIFCSIVNKKTPSYIIDENKSAIAVLELNPISKGHTLIIPKEHISDYDKLPQQVFSLAKKISKKLKSKLKPKKTEIAFTNLFGHEIVNVFPVYNNETIHSERYHEDKKTLESLYKKLISKSLKKTKAKKTKKKTKKTKPKPKEKKLWLPQRIP